MIEKIQTVQVYRIEGRIVEMVFGPKMFCVGDIKDMQIKTGEMTCLIEDVHEFIDPWVAVAQCLSPFVIDIYPINSHLIARFDYKYGGDGIVTLSNKDGTGVRFAELHIHDVIPF